MLNHTYSIGGKNTPVQLSGPTMLSPAAGPGSYEMAAAARQRICTMESMISSGDLGTLIRRTHQSMNTSVLCCTASLAFHLCMFLCVSVSMPPPEVLSLCLYVFHHCFLFPFSNGYKTSLKSIYNVARGRTADHYRNGLLRYA